MSPCFSVSSTVVSPATIRKLECTTVPLWSRPSQSPERLRNCSNAAAAAEAGRAETGPAAAAINANTKTVFIMSLSVLFLEFVERGLPARLIAGETLRNIGKRQFPVGDGIVLVAGCGIAARQPERSPEFFRRVLFPVGFKDPHGHRRPLLAEHLHAIAIDVDRVRAGQGHGGFHKLVGFGRASHSGQHGGLGSERGK